MNYPVEPTVRDVMTRDPRCLRGDVPSLKGLELCETESAASSLSTKEGNFVALSPTATSWCEQPLTGAILNELQLLDVCSEAPSRYRAGGRSGQRCGTDAESIAAPAADCRGEQADRHCDLAVERSRIGTRPNK